MRSKQSKFGFLAFVTLLLLTYSLPSILAQSSPAPTIEIQPTSGPPGTIVTIRDLGGNRANPCFAQSANIPAQNIGTMAGTIAYTIGSDLAEGSVVSFWCGGVAGGAAPSNTVRFSVTAPVVVDSDGDGLPDTRDTCPNQAGPVDNGGCPEQVPDSDGDGLPDDVDACPNVIGARQDNGCPPPATAVPLPVLPTDGACVLATLDVNAVNVREGTSTDTAIVGSLNPYHVYNVVGRNVDASWLQIEQGWVAAFVTRQGGNCANLPQTDAPEIVPTQPELVAPEGDGSTEGLLLPAVQQVLAVSTELEGCPDLIPQVQALPTFLALSIVNEGDPCAAAQAQVDDLFFNQSQQSQVSPKFGQMCDPVTPSANNPYNFAVEILVGIYYISPPDTQNYIANITQGEPQAYCNFLWMFILKLIGPPASPDPSQTLPLSLGYCGIENQGPMTTKVNALNIDEDYIRDVGFICDLYTSLLPLGSVTPAQVDFFNLLNEFCDLYIGDAANRAFSDAIRGAFDAGAALEQGCAGYQLLESYPLPPDLQPALPTIANGNDECTGNFRMLATHNDNIGMGAMYRILKSVDPCGAAIEYAMDGSVPSNVVPPPACIEAGTMTLGSAVMNQTVLDASSPWYLKIGALDRPQDTLCDPLLGQGNGGFAVPPTATQGAFVSNPTATLPSFAANPTATPLPSNTPGSIAPNPTSAGPTATELGLIANPTATEGGGVVVTSTFTPTPEEPLQLAPTNTQAPLPTATPQGQIVAPTPIGEGDEPDGDVPPPAVGECFGCLSGEPLLPGGRARMVMIGTDESGNFAGLFALPSSIDPNLDTGAIGFVQLPLGEYSQPLPDSPVILSPDGKQIGYFAQGVDRANLPPTVRQLTIALPDGSTDDPLPMETFSLNFEEIKATATSDDALSLETVIFFPQGLTPAMYAPAWSADSSTLFVSLTDAAGMTSIYALQLNAEGGVQIPFQVVTNGFAPNAAPNGRYMAFERNDANGRNIYALEMNSLQENAITQQMPGSECYAPKFGANSLKVFFTCQANGEQQMYRYGLDGITPIVTSVEGARNPIPGEADGRIFFDDGATVYSSPEDGSNPVPYSYELENVLVSSYSTGGSGE